MAVVADLTIAELTDGINDQAVKDWWDNAPGLPADVDMVELLGKTLQGAYIAQQKKNAAATNLQAGEALNSYPAPTTSAVQTDVSSGVQSFTATHSINVIYSVDQNLAVPARI